MYVCMYVCMYVLSIYLSIYLYVYQQLIQGGINKTPSILVKSCLGVGRMGTPTFLADQAHEAPLRQGLLFQRQVMGLTWQQDRSLRHMSYIIVTYTS